MLRKLALGLMLTAGAGLAGCGHEQKTAQLPGAIAPAFGFFYLDEGPSAKLAYGEPNSDNVGLMLQCARGSRMVEVSDVVRSAPAKTLTLTSAGQSSALATEVQSGEGAPLIVAHVPAAAPALAAFRKSGQMEVSYAGLRYGVAAKPPERPAVERFFAACERPV
ncbi:MAG TPA: hypothetical protein VL358_10385 [Caulobacteraceae bacterium]|jgi:hypothetical protein|nr:hypothetical protein [Caulobacteraceae bacterium]